MEVNPSTVLMRLSIESRVVVEVLESMPATSQVTVTALEAWTGEGEGV